MTVKTVANYYKIIDTSMDSAAPNVTITWENNLMMSHTLQSALALSLIALSPLVLATGSDKYPASDFQPTVIYADKDLVAQSAPASEFDPKYPAANFEAKVVYIDKELAAQSQAPAEEEVKDDPKYPAAYFKPKVIYP